MTTKRLIDQIRVPVNPGYDLDLPPEEQEFQYVNPVTLNNQLIALANSGLTVTEHSVSASRKIQDLKLQLRKKERELEDFEEDLLRAQPLDSKESKSNKTIQAAISFRAERQDRLEELLAMREEIRALEDEIWKYEATVRTCTLYWGAIERVSDNIKTHLSFVKAEQRHL